MKKLYTFLFVLLCTITASADKHFYLMSDSIFEPTKYKETEYEKPDGTKISMYGYHRQMIDEDGFIPLTGEYQYVQITGQPFYVVYYDTDTEGWHFMYAYDYFFDIKYDEKTNAYYAASDYYKGEWSPKGSGIENDMTKDAHGFFKDKWPDYWTQNYTRPWWADWYTFQNQNEEEYYSFKTAPGLYVVKLIVDPINFGVVLGMWNLCDLYIPPTPTIKCSISIWDQYKEVDANVNVWYTYYTISGGKDKTRYKQLATYDMDNANVFASGEYAGYHYQKLYHNWNVNSTYANFCYNNFPYAFGNDRNPAELNKWYDLTNSDTIYTLKFSEYPSEGLWAIWDTEGYRVKILNDSDFQKALAESTDIDSPIVVPYTTNYYSLDGQVVENPTPGKIYIHNGKKVVYKK